MTENASKMLLRGDHVEKTGGDYSFKGTVVSVFEKASGARRVVVENPEGILHIFSEKQLTLTQPYTVD